MSCKSFIVLGVIATMIACAKEDNHTNTFPELMEAPGGFPEMYIPENNSFTLSRWELGKKLFYEKALSIDSSIACASCHKPELGFADDQVVSRGAMGRLGRRNAPTLANIGYHPYYTREGGVPTLEMQVLVPIQEHDEFAHNLVLIVDRLKIDQSYQEMAQEAYGRDLDEFVITRALANFERSLISGWSRFDDYVEDPLENQLNESEMRGMKLFFSEQTNCSKCHSGFDFTNYEFHNNGLYQMYQDEGRYRLTKEDTDLAKFKIPSLRNIALTAPYMHDGSLESLSQVISHYETGGNDHVNKSPLLTGFNISSQQKNDLINFLHTLTDYRFIENSIFSNK